MKRKMRPERERIFFVNKSEVFRPGLSQGQPARPRPSHLQPGKRLDRKRGPLGERRKRNSHGVRLGARRCATARGGLGE